MNAKNFLSTLAVAAVLGLPSMASANSLWHTTNDELGATMHPSHMKSNQTRQQVRSNAQVEMGRQLIFDGEKRVKDQPDMRKSRSQVMQEMRSQSEQEKRARAELYLN